MASKGKVKILFIIDFLYGLHGGTENQLVKLINNLNKRVYDIHLLCLRKSRWVDEHESELDCAITCYHIVKLKNPRNILLFFSILRFVKRIRPDVVMTFFPLSNVLGVVIARMAGAKCIVSTRRDYGLWLGKGMVPLRFANMLAQRILTNSYKVRELTAREEHFPASRIDVIYNGINAHALLADPSGKEALKKQYGIPEGVPVVGIVGGLKPMKRHITFIKAAKNVLEGRADIHFLIVGDGLLRKGLGTLANDLGIAEHVHFVGTQEDVLPFLGILDVGVNCSANEGLSNAILEYMTHGVPCIVSRVGGNPELIEHDVNGYLFELDDEKDLSALIERLLADQETRKVFALRSRERILRSFTLEKMIEKYDRYFTYIREASR